MHVYGRIFCLIKVKSILLFLIWVFSISVKAQDLNVGIRIQKTQEMYWENGLAFQYSFPNFKPKQFFIGLDYVTSRMGTAYRSNAIKQDNYILSASWVLNPKKSFQVRGRLNVGYFYSDLEEAIFDEIPNEAFLLSPEIGLTYRSKQWPISLNIGAGYYIITEEDGYSPGTLQPLYYHLDIYYTLFKFKIDE